MARYSRRNAIWAFNTNNFEQIQRIVIATEEAPLIILETIRGVICSVELVMIASTVSTIKEYKNTDAYPSRLWNKF